MTFEKALAARDAIEARLDAHSTVLEAMPKGPMNLIADAAKQTAEYKVAKIGADHAFSELRAFNSWFVKTYKSELRAYHAKRRMGGGK